MGGCEIKDWLSRGTKQESGVSKLTIVKLSQTYLRAILRASSESLLSSSLINTPRVGSIDGLEVIQGMVHATYFNLSYSLTQD